MSAAKCAWRLAAPWALAVLSVRMAVRTASKADWTWLLSIVNKRKRKTNCREKPCTECTRRALTVATEYTAYSGATAPCILDGHFPNDSDIPLLWLAASKRGGYLN